MQPVFVKKKKSVLPALKKHSKDTKQLLNAAAKEIENLQQKIESEKRDCDTLLNLISEISEKLATATTADIRSMIVQRLYFFKPPVIELDEEEFDKFHKY